MLFDAGMHTEPGVRPYEHKKILLTHAHGDHIGAARTMKELTGAQLYLGERDLFIIHERRDLIYSDGYTCGEIEPDKVYSDDAP